MLSVRENRLPGRHVVPFLDKESRSQAGKVSSEDGALIRFDTLDRLGSDSGHILRFASSDLEVSQARFALGCTASVAIRQIEVPRS